MEPSWWLQSSFSAVFTQHVMVSVSWKGLQGVFFYDKTEMLKHVDYFIPATAEPRTTNTRTKHVVRAAGATTKFPSSPLSPSILVSPPSHHLPHEAAVNAASTGCPLHSCAWKLLYAGGQTASFGDKHGWAVHSCLPMEQRLEHLMLSGQLSHLLFFQLHPKTAIDTLPRTKLNFGRGQNEAACFDFLSAPLTVHAYSCSILLQAALWE